MTGGPVKVNAVHLNGADGLSLVDWGWKPFTGGDLGGPAGPASELGFTRAPITFDCAGTRLAEFVVSVERTGGGLGLARSYTIRYRDRSLDVPLKIALCPQVCPEPF